jgi:tRNA U34 2-thiouridine synthase MnmA/TrmU
MSPSYSIKSFLVLVYHYILYFKNCFQIQHFNGLIYALFVKNINWIARKPPKLPMKIEAKIRYRSQSVPAVITKNLKSAIYNLKFARPQRAVTPGQSAVFYRGQELLGGG